MRTANTQITYASIYADHCRSFYRLKLCSRRTTKALIRLRACEAGSWPALFAYAVMYFSVWYNLYHEVEGSGQLTIEVTDKRQIQMSLSFEWYSYQYKRLTCWVKISADDILIFLSYFSQQVGFDLQWKLTICMKYQRIFSGKIRKYH